MEPFKNHTGKAVAMDRANVDTDQIIPKQFLKRIERTGFGQFLFFDWRFHDDGSDNPEFELNKPAAAGSTVLLARRNFGSGSSREHAVWSLADYGFKAVIAPSFADIFYNNCFKNGVLPVKLTEDEVTELFNRTAANENYQVKVDLEALKVTDDQGLSFSFEVDDARRDRMLQGLDDIAATLTHEEKILAYEQAHGIAG